MIPLKDGFYEKMDFERIEDDEYVDLLKKEYLFCRSKKDLIIDSFFSILIFLFKTRFMKC